MAESCDQLVARGGWQEDAVLHRCAFPIGPRNTWSNLAYGAAGLAVALASADPSRWAFAGAMLVLCLGSGLYHGFKTLWSNALDHAGMYAALASLAVHAEVPGAPWAAWAMAVSSGVAAGIFAYPLAKSVNLEAMMGTLLVFAALPAFAGGSPPLAVGSLALFLVAYGLQRLDHARSPLVGLWGHAAWHVLTALAMGLMYLAQLRATP